MSDIENGQSGKQDQVFIVEQNSLLSAMTEASPDAVILADQSLQIVYCNAAACSLFEYERDELIGMSCALLVPEDIRGAFQAFLSRPDRAYSMNTNGSIIETRCLKKTGGQVAIETSNFAWKRGDTIYFGSIFHDIPERKEAEKRLTEAFSAVKQLQGLLPICSWCKKVRDDSGFRRYRFVFPTP